MSEPQASESCRSLGPATAGASRVAVYDNGDVIAARQKARHLAEKLGFASTDVTLIVTAVSEVARNIVEHAGEGTIELSIVGSSDAGDAALVVVAHDDGPGIPDVEAALRDGFSTTGALGLGLPGARRLMDSFAVESAPGRGTTVVMTRKVGGAVR
jgi:serine/threonine-protein kinase RsbT